MYKCLTLAVFCILGGTIEAATQPQRTTMYVHPKNPHLAKTCCSTAGPTVPVFYTQVGGYTNRPQYVRHRPTYYVRSSIFVKKQPDIIVSDLP